MLVPEIALTPQAAGRFAARFGDGLAILHSGLTDAERRDERERIARGEARIVVGARSAIFAPVRDLGLICVDEEHDQSYKQDSDPRYDARTVAAKRAALEGAVAVYGSATPRPESWERLDRLDLGGRLVGSLPPVRVVDLRREAGYPLSAPLLAALGRVAAEGGKAILLLNRRGIAPAIHCRACGTTLRCPNCDVALVLHRDDVLHCHHCGHTVPSPEICPACASPELARIGAGTEKLEQELAKAVPELERIRLDADVVAERGAVPEALRRFAETDRAVLLGTQMVAKGHHFAGVSLAAVVDADTQLGLPDFRAEERTFALLTQLAGRSGRDAPGRVIVQTFQPDARAVAYAARHDVAGFLNGRAGAPARARLPALLPPRPDRRRGRRPGAAAHRAPGARVEVPGGRAARAGAAPSPARSLSRPADREDGRAATRRRARGPARSPRRPGDAPRRAHRGRRRRPARASEPARTGRRLLAVADEAGELRDTGDLDAEALARRRMALSQIRQYPDPALRMRANEVEHFDDSLRQLAERMTALMADAYGVGLAATQVGVLQRLFVFQSGDEEPRVLVNPRIVQQSDELEMDEEGCLSLQRVLVPVERSVKVTIEAQDLDGDDVRLELDELPARVAQHELDHLDGVLILDRTTDDARREAMATLRAQLSLA